MKRQDVLLLSFIEGTMSINKTSVADSSASRKFLQGGKDGFAKAGREMLAQIGRISKKGFLEAALG